MLSRCRALRMSLMPMIFSWWKRSRILISLSVRWQYVWCSNGLIFLMATRWLVTLSIAELDREDVERSTKQVSYYTLYNSHTHTMTLSETGLILSSERALQTVSLPGCTRDTSFCCDMLGSTVGVCPSVGAVWCRCRVDGG